MSIANAAHCSMMLKRAGSGGIPYAANGLVAMWDGEWNSEVGIHDPNATTWTDIVGGRVLTLNGNASFGANYMETSDNDSGAIGDFTLDNIVYAEVVFICTGSSVGWYSLFDDVSNWWIWCEPDYYDPNAAGFGAAYWEDGYFVGNRADGINSVQLAVGGSVAKTNGVDMIVDVGGGGEPGLGAFSIFGNVGNTDAGACCKGRCYSCRFYSRIPTAAELAANYNIDKIRFGLP